MLHYLPMDIFYKCLNGKAWALSHRHSTLLVMAAAFLGTVFVSLKPFDWLIRHCTTISFRRKEVHP